MKLGDKIKFVRSKRGWTQAELQDRSGVSKSYIASIETGEKENIPIKTLRKLAKGLNVPLAFIVNEEAVTPGELSEITGFTIPNEILEFIAQQDSIDFILLTKDAKESGMSPDVFKVLLNNYKYIMNNKKDK